MFGRATSGTKHRCGVIFVSVFLLKETRFAHTYSNPTAAKLVIGASTALPACTLCICRCLAMIGGNKTVGLNHGDRRRVAIFDLGLCWGIPIIFMALRASSGLPSQSQVEELTRLLDYLVQDHRYNIVQYIGCQPATYVSIPVIFIVWLPPLLLSLGTFVYAGAWVRHLFAASTPHVLF